MAIKKIELIEWLDRLPRDATIAINEDGLALVQIDSLGGGEIDHFEVGGVPEKVFFSQGRVFCHGDGVYRAVTKCTVTDSVIEGEVDEIVFFNKEAEASDRIRICSALEADSTFGNH